MLTSLGDPATMLSKLRILAVLGALSPVLHAFARQIPVVGGVVGGVPKSEPAVHIDAAASPAATTPGKLRVTENSGVCETTPGVYQASGYGDLTSSESIWYAARHVRLPVVDPCSSDSVDRFWFFAARENPDTAPLAIWLNGGVSDRPCTAMDGPADALTAGKFEHDRASPRERTVPYQQ